MLLIGCGKRVATSVTHFAEVMLLAKGLALLGPS
jgi:hypothetical protein